MLEALKATLRDRAVDASLEAVRNLALGLALQGRAAGKRRVTIRARVTPVRYRGLRSRRATMRMRAAFALEAAKRFAAAAVAAHAAAKGVG